jgi:hypothetical protein
MSAASAHHLASRSLHPWELIAASSVAGEARDRRRSWTPPRQRDARDPVWEGCGGLAPTFDDRWGRQQAGAWPVARSVRSLALLPPSLASRCWSKTADRQHQHACPRAASRCRACARCAPRSCGRLHPTHQCSTRGGLIRACSPAGAGATWTASSPRQSGARGRASLQREGGGLSSPCPPPNSWTLCWARTGTWKRGLPSALCGLRLCGRRLSGPCPAVPAQARTGTWKSGLPSALCRLRLCGRCLSGPCPALPAQTVRCPCARRLRGEYSLSICVRARC